jgi:hypothetical protein
MKKTYENHGYFQQFDAPKPASPGSRASSTTSTSSCRAEVSCGQGGFGEDIDFFTKKIGI